MKSFFRLLMLMLIAPAAIAGLGVPLHAAQAMQFTLREVPGNRTVIDATGPVVPGDFHRLLAFCDTIDKAERLAGLIVDSPGGSVLEAEKMAGAIRDMQLSVAVAAHGKCASACFLMFAAAPYRLAGAGARIGVHRASLAGEETAGSMGATDGMAVQIAHFGVPPAIVAKMTQTGPGGVTWLTPADMASMHVVVTDPDAGPNDVMPPEPGQSRAK